MKSNLSELKNNPEIAQFEIQDLLKIGMLFVVLGIMLVYGLNVIEDTKEDVACTNSSFTFNASAPDSVACFEHGIDPNGNTTMAVSTAGTAADDAITGVAKFPSKMPLLATVVLAAVMIGILLRYLYVRYA